ncbi:hypothetical protein ACHHYP_13091 [Achlya hypogyna]|uniref:Uncharacterized protein n=1 Tax=Achlya hypogyna TaxID=1202772 RepID=A0A1V9YG37_ACHHY|nr:hypothetical protein ACHHYP_13091 [Achlya hypogyna]
MQRRRTPVTVLKELQNDWDKAIGEGTGRLTQIANALQKATYADGESWGILMDATGLHNQLRQKLQREAHQVKRNLEALIDRLAAIVGCMRHTCFFEAMPTIETVVLDSDPTTTLSKFQYESILQELVLMYEREIMAKALIVDDILDCTGHDAALLYIAAWQMQPFVDKTRQAELFALLALDANPKKLAANASHKLVR